MTPLFKKISEAKAAISANEVDNPNKIKTVEIAATKISSVLASSLAHSKLHTTTRRFIERESKLRDAVFFALERVLEVKSYAHYLKREDLEKLRDTKASINDVNEILEKFNTGLVVYHSSENLEKKEKILISQIQEIVGTYLETLDNTVD